MGKIDWEQLLQIEDSWPDSFLLKQAHSRDLKTVVRGYTLKFSGTENKYTTFTQELCDIIANFIYGKADIARKKSPIRAGNEARLVFGKADPAKDGKYGELILFALVESVLRCPMVAHKIPTSFNDQVKGGDGLFMGMYEDQTGTPQEAILIGEAKIWQGYAPALEDALKSVNRFHDDTNSSQFVAQEFMVAMRSLSKLEGVDLEALYDYLSPDKEEYQSCLLVHPTFIMYETPEIDNIETIASRQQEAEELIKAYIKKEHKTHQNLIKTKTASYPALKKIYLDFFILPVRNVAAFRNDLYFRIHATPYQPNPSTK